MPCTPVHPGGVVPATPADQESEREGVQCVRNLMWLESEVVVAVVASKHEPPHQLLRRWHKSRKTEDRS